MVTDEHSNLCQLLKKCKGKENYKGIVSCLKNILEHKSTITIKITDKVGQLFCCILTEIINQDDMDDLDEITVICDALVSQVSHSRVRSFLLDKCQLLQCLTKKYLKISEVKSQIKICKTMQTYLIYSHTDESNSLLSIDLVCQLIKSLVNNIQLNQIESFNETNLGLLAILCQIWWSCTKLTNILDEYNILRKALLKFMSADKVKRTTIVYTMTIMFHLCNSDDRLFSKRNMRQTLQVLFNIMLNKDDCFASFYAANLLIEISRSPRTVGLFKEYKKLPNSLNEILLKLNRREVIVVERFLEFILAIISLDSEYRKMVVEKILKIKPTKGPLSNNELVDTGNEANFVEIMISDSEPVSRKDFMSDIIFYVGHTELNICFSATKLIDIVYMELNSLKQTYPIPNLELLCETIHFVLRYTPSNPAQNFNNNQQKTQLTIQNDLNSTEQYLKNKNIFTNLTRIKLLIEMATNMLVIGEYWIDLVKTLVNEIDRVILNQLECNLLCLDDYESIKTILLDDSTQNNEALLKVMSLSVDLFIDILHLYYRSTKLWPNINLFQDKLKVHLEHKNCPLVLAFALSATFNNQSTLRRALILQGMCLHFKKFNVELMSKKMYQYATDFSKLKTTIKTKQSQLSTLNQSMTLSQIKQSSQCTIQQEVSSKPIITVQNSSQILNTTTSTIKPTKRADIKQQELEKSPSNQSLETGSTNSHLNCTSFSSGTSTIRQFYTENMNCNNPNKLKTNQMANGDNPALSCQDAMEIIEDDISQALLIINNHALLKEAKMESIGYESAKSMQEACSLAVPNGEKITNSDDKQPILKIKRASEMIHQENIAHACQNSQNLDKKPSDIECQFPATKIDCMIDEKVKEIVQNLIDNPKKSFTPSEICYLYERRIQSLQSQESLMEEIINKTSRSLHEYESMVAKYRNKLNQYEKEYRIMRNTQSDLETKVNELTTQNDQNIQKINQLEHEKQTLTESNQLIEGRQKEVISIVAKTQRKLFDISKTNDKAIDELNEKLDEANRLIAQKDSQLESYSHVTKLINKLAFNNNDSIPKLSKASLPPIKPNVRVNCVGNTNANNCRNKSPPIKILSPPPLFNSGHRTYKPNTTETSNSHEKDTLKHQQNLPLINTTYTYQSRQPSIRTRTNNQALLKKSKSTTLLPSTNNSSNAKQVQPNQHTRHNSMLQISRALSPSSVTSSLSAHDIMQLYKINNYQFLQLNNQ